MPVTATGGTITNYTDGNGLVWTVHTFTSTANLVVTSGGTVSYLVVAGGGPGGGGQYNSGGGGAGGFLTGNLSIVSGNYVITVGAGGAGTTTRGTNGSNSSFSTAVAVGGGAGGSHPSNPINGLDGGSGGGGSQGGSAGGNGVAGQGNAGGGNWYAAGAGGGGAGASVPTGTGSNPYNGNTVAVTGGIGLQSSITGTAVYYAGGGGAGQRDQYSVPRGNGGLGGGGQGGADPGNGTSGTANRGGGGGGSGGNDTNTRTGGSGGSGIVIIAYANLPSASDGGIGGPYAGGGGGAGQDGYVGRSTPWYIHSFYGSGNFNISSGSGNVRYLVVGAGGGGGSDMGGGGGGGGFVTGNTSVTAGAYTVAVGAGGAGAPAGVGQVRGVTGGSSAVVSAANLKGSSYGFDGYGDYVTIPYNTTNFDWYTASVDYTIEAWVFYIFANNENSGAPNMVGNMTDNTTTNYWSFGPMNNGTVRFYYYNGSAQSVTSSSTLTTNTWNHIAMTKTNSGITIFVNGVAQTTTAISGTPQSSSGTVLTLARYNTVGLIGYISNLRIVKGTAVYTGNFTPPTSPLTAITNTTLLTAQDIAFQDNSVNNYTVTKYGDAFGGYWSPFNPMSSPGGGGGGSEYSNNNSPPASGGSGGGVASSGQTTVAYGITVGNIGSNGGSSGGSYYPGGGGGANNAGTNTPGNGGNGRISNILGANYYWSGGGGGAGYSGIAGNGGLGGGGGGAPLVSGGGFGGTGGLNPGANATAGSLNSQTNVPGGAGGNNTGGGGGGGSHYNVNNQGGAGGSGFVAIAYSSQSGIVATGGTITVVSILDTNTGGSYGARGNAIQAGANGTLGGGGGGGSSATVAGGGGGISFNGAGDNGNAGIANGGQGGGGSNGFAALNGNGGLYGGGGGATTNSVVDPSVGNGGHGALKIYWQGNVLQYPYPVQANNVTQSVNAGVSNELLDSGTLFPKPQANIVQVDSEMMFVANSTLTDNIVANVVDILSTNQILVQGIGPTSNNPAMNITEITVNLSDQEMMLDSNIVNAPVYLKTVEVITSQNNPENVDPGKVPIVVKGWTGEVYPQVQVWF